MRSKNCGPMGQTHPGHQLHRLQRNVPADVRGTATAGNGRAGRFSPRRPGMRLRRRARMPASRSSANGALIMIRIGETVRESLIHGAGTSRHGFPDCPSKSHRLRKHRSRGPASVDAIGGCFVDHLVPRHERPAILFEEVVGVVTRVVSLFQSFQGGPRVGHSSGLSYAERAALEHGLSSEIVYESLRLINCGTSLTPSFGLPIPFGDLFEHARPRPLMPAATARTLVAGWRAPY